MVEEKVMVDTPNKIKPTSQVKKGAYGFLARWLSLDIKSPAKNRYCWADALQSQGQGRLEAT